jgi:hypothetical protein
MQNGKEHSPRRLTEIVHPLFQVGASVTTSGAMYSLPLGIGAALCLGGGYICSSIAKSRTAEFEFLTHSTASTARDVFKSLKDKRLAGPSGGSPDPSGVFEIQGMTWVPEVDLVKSRMDNELVILRREVTTELVDVPYTVRGNGGVVGRV